MKNTINLEDKRREKEIQIQIRDNVLVVSSREVAENFDKRHDHVLRDIDNLIRGVTQDWGNLFCETTYVHEQNKQEYREFLMNKDGFSLLVMGFTGQKALEWKLKYIQAFNEMKDMLKKDSYVIDDKVERAKRWILEEKERLALKEQVKQLEDTKKTLITTRTTIKDSRAVINVLIRNIATKSYYGNFKKAYSEFYKILNGILKINVKGRKRKSGESLLSTLNEVEMTQAEEQARAWAVSMHIDVDKILTLNNPNN